MSASDIIVEDFNGGCTFQDSWLSSGPYKDWVAKDPKDNHTAVCRLCKSRLDIRTMGRSALTSHSTTKKHLDRESLQKQCMPLGFKPVDKIGRASCRERV